MSSCTYHTPLAYVLLVSVCALKDQHFMSTPYNSFLTQSTATKTGHSLFKFLSIKEDDYCYCSPTKYVTWILLLIKPAFAMQFSLSFTNKDHTTKQDIVTL